MRPGLVWLGLVPLLHYVWNFVNVIAVRRSFARLAAEKPAAAAVDGGYAAGIASSLASAASPPLALLERGPPGNLGESGEIAVAVAGLLLAVTWLVGWIVNWSKVVSSRSVLGA